MAAALDQYSHAGTRAEQLAQIDQLISAWGDGRMFGAANEASYGNSFERRAA